MAARHLLFMAVGAAIRHTTGSIPACATQIDSVAAGPAHGRKLLLYDSKYDRCSYRVVLPLGWVDSPSRQFLHRLCRPPSPAEEGLKSPSRSARPPTANHPLPPSRRIVMRGVPSRPLSCMPLSLDLPRHARTVILNTGLAPHRFLGVVERSPAPDCTTHPSAKTLFALVKIRGCHLWLVRRLFASGRLGAALGVTCS
jgi:hypothetical protein